MLHLHRLDDEQGLPRRHALTDTDGDRHHRAGHGRPHLRVDRALDALQRRAVLVQQLGPPAKEPRAPAGGRGPAAREPDDRVILPRDGEEGAPAVEHEHEALRAQPQPGRRQHRAGEGGGIRMRTRDDRDLDPALDLAIDLAGRARHEHGGGSASIVADHIPRGPGALQTEAARPHPRAGALGSTLPLGMREEGGSGDRGVVPRWGRAGGGLPSAAFDEAGIQSPGTHIIVGQQRAQRLEVGGNAEHERGGERRVESRERRRAVGGMHDDLGQQGVVVGGDLMSHLQPRVDAHPLSGRLAQGEHRARRRQEGGVLGAQSGLDRPAHRLRRSRRPHWRQGERLPGGDAQLLLDEVDAHHQLGDGVLYLQARVHLHEEEGARIRFGDKEFDGAGSAIVHAPRHGAGGLAHRSARSRIE